MILFLTDRGVGKRGGEETNARLFKFFNDIYKDVYPERLTEVIGDLNSPWKHARYKLNLVKKYSPDLAIVDISAAFRNILALRWLKKNRKKIMTIFLGQRMDFRYHNWLVQKAVRYCEKYTLKNSSLICVNSKYTANLAGRKADKKAKIIITHPVSTNIAHETAEVDFRDRNRQRPLRLLFVGACTRVKGLIYLIKALALIRGLDFKLHIVGEYDAKGSYYRKIMKIIENDAMGDKVEFSGFMSADRLSEFYRDSSIFIVPSISEGYGLVLVEALSFGLPIIASKAGAIPEVVNDGENAILVEPENPETLAKSIMELAADPERMDDMSRANLEKSRKARTWDMYFRELEERLVPAIAGLTGIHPAEKRQGEGSGSK